MCPPADPTLPGPGSPNRVSTAGTATAQPRPIPDSYWVVPGRFLAGRYPGSWDPDETSSTLARLLGAGITRFMNLTQLGEGDERAYEPLLEEAGRAVGRRITHQRFAIPDFDVPSADQMRIVLDTIQSALDVGESIYLHCWAGVGRTGTVVGCFLVEQGLTGDEALARIGQLRSDLPTGSWPSPESAAQAEMVRRWAGSPRGR
jgi:hypothetical protein